MPKYSVEWNPLFNDLKVRIPHLDKDWTELPPEMMSLWNTSSGKSTISEYVLNKLVDKFIKERKLITSPNKLEICDIEGYISTTVIPKRDLFIRANLSNWFIEMYPSHQIEGIARMYSKKVKINPPDIARSVLSEDDVQCLFDVKQPFVLWHFSELSRVFDIKLFNGLKKD